MVGIIMGKVREVADENISAGSGPEYLGCYALPLLRTNAHILRLPFEL